MNNLLNDSEKKNLVGAKHSSLANGKSALFPASKTSEKPIKPKGYGKY